MAMHYQTNKARSSVPACSVSAQMKTKNGRKMINRKRRTGRPADPKLLIIPRHLKRSLTVINRRLLSLEHGQNRIDSLRHLHCTDIERDVGHHPVARSPRSGDLGDLFGWRPSGQTGTVTGG